MSLTFPWYDKFLEWLLAIRVKIFGEKKKKLQLPPEGK